MDLAKFRRSFVDQVIEQLSPEEASEFDAIHEIIENVGTGIVGESDEWMESLVDRRHELVRKAMDKLHGG